MPGRKTVTRLSGQLGVIDKFKARLASKFAFKIPNISTQHQTTLSDVTRKKRYITIRRNIPEVGGRDLQATGR